MARQVAQVVAGPGRCNLAGHGHQDDQALSFAALSAIAQRELEWHQQVSVGWMLVGWRELERSVAGRVKRLP